MTDMDKDASEIFTAYYLASYNLGATLQKVTLVIQSGTKVDPLDYQVCLDQIQTQRIVLNLLEAWLMRQLPVVEE